MAAYLTRAVRSDFALRFAPVAMHLSETLGPEVVPHAPRPYLASLNTPSVPGRVPNSTNGSQLPHTTPRTGSRGAHHTHTLDDASHHTLTPRPRPKARCAFEVAKLLVFALTCHSLVHATRMQCHELCTRESCRRAWKGRHVPPPLPRHAPPPSPTRSPSFPGLYQPRPDPAAPVRLVAPASRRACRVTCVWRAAWRLRHDGR